MYEDKTLTCKECGESFTFTISEQEFFAGKGFTNEPGRCPTCRATRKEQGRFRGGNENRQMYTVTCSQCGASATVPFRPTGDKPVYCRDCYQTVRR